MKFGIKHALVVAICALCVCVVATGTVLAVTYTRRDAEASEPDIFTITGLLRIGWAGSPQVSEHMNIQILGAGLTGVSTIGQSIQVPGGQTIKVIARPSPEQLAARGGRVAWLHHGIGMTGGDVDCQPSAWSYGNAEPQWDWIRPGFRATWFDSRPNVMLITLPLNVLDSGSRTVSLWARGANLTGGSLPPFPNEIRVHHQLTRRANVTDPAVITRPEGWHDVVTDTANTAGTIPAPTAAQMGGTGTFRGWAMVQNGSIIFPVGLPMPVFSDMEIWAIRN